MSNGTKEDKRWVRTLFANIVKAHATVPKKRYPGESKAEFDARRDLAIALQKSADETPAEHRHRRIAIIGQRWNHATPSTMTSFFTTRRRPTKKTHPQFFVDLKRWGCVEFTEQGELKVETLDKGPGLEQFLDETPAGSDRPRSARAEATP